MDILGLSTSPSSGGAYALILNELEGSRRLPIIIGTFEAQAIALELEHIKPPRPMTHDLMRNIIQSFDTHVKEVYINDLKEGTFYAKVIYEHDGEDIEQDSRPSDAIAIAIRFNSPIYVHQEILEEAGILSDQEGEEGEEEAQQSESTTIHEEPESSEPSTETGTPESELKKLEKNLANAIEKEDYEKAARLRDEIKKMKG